MIYSWADIAHQGLRKTVDTTAEGGLQLDFPSLRIGSQLGHQPEVREGRPRRPSEV